MKILTCIVQASLVGMAGYCLIRIIQEVRESARWWQEQAEWVQRNQSSRRF